MRNKFKPSVHQQAIFDFVTDDARSLIIQAVAGSGKTTTILNALDLLPDDLKILFLAFNASIAKELAERVPEHVLAKTFHSTCFGAWMRAAKTKPEVDEGKIRKIISKRFGTDDVELYGAFVQRLVGHAKNEGIGYLIPDVSAEWHKIINHYDLTLDYEAATIDRAIDLAQKTLRASDQNLTVFDFDDMLRIPLIKDVRFFQNDFVFVDEAQDTNPVQRALLKRMVSPRGGRLIAVGDSAQAIYGFRGASSDAMDIIKCDFGCEELPLSVSYRCSKAVVRKAQEVVPHIEFFESAPEGSVESLGTYSEATFNAADAILCRNTAPLVGFAFALIGRGVGCQILGREIGAGLVKLIEKMKAKGVDALGAKLEGYREREVAKLMSKGKESAAEAINDRVDCIQLFLRQLDENHRTVPALIRKIEDLFSDRNSAGLLTLCTAHKSKGREWNTVFLLDANEYMPSKWARQKWQQEQELNLIYVAYTRAMTNLHFISSNRWGGVA